MLADGSPLLPPRVQGFGRCLLHAIQAMLDDGARAACVLNSDSPTLPTALLVEAAQVLLDRPDRVVLGPAEDGGYYLLGMGAPHAHLFEDIAWSTDSVAEATRERARTLGLELVELAPWYDVDDRDALLRLIEEISVAGDRRGDGALYRAGHRGMPRPHRPAPCGAVAGGAMSGSCVPEWLHRSLPAMAGPRVRPKGRPRTGSGRPSTTLSIAARPLRHATKACPGWPACAGHDGKGTVLLARGSPP